MTCMKKLGKGCKKRTVVMAVVSSGARRESEPMGTRGRLFTGNLVIIGIFTSCERLFTEAF